MTEPKFYERYDRSEALALFGEEAEGRNLCDGQWLIFPGVVIGFAELGDPPLKSNFTSATRFCWVAEKPYRVNDDKHFEFVPPDVLRRRRERPQPIHLFVREGGSGPYTYVGGVGPSSMQKVGGGNHGEAHFDLNPALPSEVWAGLGGLRPGDLDHAAVDAALARLRHPVNVEERLEVLRRVVAYWHGPIRHEDGFDGAELKGVVAPYPLRWWYKWAGRRPEVMSGQNHLLAPDRLRIEDGLLVFYAENQWCYQWGTPPEGDDPPVFGRVRTTDPWEPEGITFSEHLILACLFEATLCHSPYGASAAWLEEAPLGKIIEHVPPIAIGPWRWCGSTRFYAGGGAFMFATSNGDGEEETGYSVTIGAKTEHPLAFLKAFLDEGWEYVAL